MDLSNFGDPDTIFVGENGWGLDGLFKSSDGGKTWAPVSRELPAVMMFGMSDGPESTYLATLFGVYKSTNAGNNWIPMNEGITAFVVRSVLAMPGPSGALYAATNNGIYKSADGGLTWKSWDLQGSSILQLLPDPANQNAIYATSTGGVQRRQYGL